MPHVQRVLPPSFPPPSFPAPDPLEAVLRTLGPRERRHVVALDEAGRLHATSPELARAFTATFVPDGARLAGGGFDLTTLARYLVPDAFGKLPAGRCESEKSGPYRRVYSNPGFAFMSARVYLPGEDAGELRENKAAGHGDTAFVYVGGWGGRGGAVDAGFQHGRASKDRVDDWAPFFLVQQAGGKSVITVSSEKQAGGAAWRLAAGTEAFLKFWVTREDGVTRLNLYVEGTTSQDGVPGSLTLSAPVDDTFGWDPSGGRNILKRMTTIGQTFGKENLTSGSFLTGVRWSEGRIGRTEADAHPWAAADTGGYCSFPDPKSPEGQRADGSGKPKWTVSFVSAAEETDGVTLT
ncbi:hypothetical protein [Deinococcus pimensis]|uniref:hypothetical protein n=1 Tax=Deinococcus pimensis TaxID=309888 RepID=UPI0004802894|nr:hypothetical protein [Deinococcus pimensis]